MKIKCSILGWPLELQHFESNILSVLKFCSEMEIGIARLLRLYTDYVYRISMEIYIKINA